MPEQSAARRHWGCPHPAPAVPPRLPLPAPPGIPTDHVLPDDPTCLPLIEKYAADQPLFFADFAAAFRKLSELGAQWA